MRQRLCFWADFIQCLVPRLNSKLRLLGIVTSDENNCINEHALSIISLVLFSDKCHHFKINVRQLF